MDFFFNVLNLIPLSTSASLLDRFLRFWESFGEFGLLIYSIFETITPISGVEFFFFSLIGENPWWRLALIATLGNAIGAVLVYYFLAHKSKFYDRFKTKDNKKQKTKKLFDEHGFLAIYIVAMTPLPFFLILLIASLAKMDFKIYILSTINSRGFRFLVTTYIMHRFSQFSTLHIILILILISIPIIFAALLIKKIIIPSIRTLISKRKAKQK